MARPTWQSGPPAEFNFPLGWLGIAAIVVPLGIYLLLWRRVARRYRLGRCLKCAYDLRESGQICPECGAPREPSPRMRWPLSIVPSGKLVGQVAGLAGGWFAVLIVALVIALWWTGRTDRIAQERYKLLPLDVARFAVATSPHLTGNVVNRIHATALAATDVAAGNLVLLGEGDYVLSELDPSTPFAKPLIQDVAMLGKSTDTTRLRLNVRVVMRLRLENMTIDCANDPCFDLRDGGSINLKNCRIVNYNSGAGGSNAICGSDVTLMIDGCTFDGSDGRNGGRSGANVFDLRGKDDVYARRTSFVENAEISRERCITYDGCTLRIAGGAAYPQGGRFIREGLAPTLAMGLFPGYPETFEEATDDQTFVDRVLQGSRADDPWMQRVLDARNLSDDPLYWAALYRDPREKIRDIAAAQLVRLKHGPSPATPATMERVPALLQKLKSPLKEEVRTARLELLAASPQVINSIRDGTGPMAALSAAQREELNRLLDLPVPLPVEVEYGRIVEKIDR